MGLKHELREEEKEKYCEFKARKAPNTREQKVSTGMRIGTDDGL